VKTKHYFSREEIIQRLFNLYQEALPRFGYHELRKGGSEAFNKAWEVIATDFIEEKAK
jgi:hypothetical protein